MKMGNKLNAVFKDVREFHTEFGAAAPDSPTPQSWDAAHSRANWVREEASELEEATALPDPVDRIVGQADAYIDMIYFAVGGLVEIGVEPSVLWDIVQSANMAKRHMIDGKLTVVRREHDGKIVKPDGWVAPEPALKAEVMRQIEIAAVDLVA